MNHHLSPASSSAPPSPHPNPHQQHAAQKPLPAAPGDSRKPAPPRPRRVLGTPSVSAKTINTLSPAANRSLARHSPSPSELSATSDLSTLPAAQTAASPTPTEPLVCPICAEQMLTLLQLNRHLDDFHAEVPPLEKDDIASWFRKARLKAKTFQPVAVLNQKLKGLDVFESNDEVAAVASAPAPERRDEELFITRVHWARPQPGQACGEPGCGKVLGAVNGSVNCRKCGGLFCEVHTMFQIKLSRSAEHEPVRGVWCRVCGGCYRGREGYLDYTGVSRDLTQGFVAVRRKNLDRVFLEVTRLEKRLTKLTAALTAPAQPPGSIFKAKPRESRMRDIEKSIVPWQADSAVAACPYCEVPFNLTTRKHHCRVCGKIVCAAPSCSKIVPLDTKPPHLPPDADPLTLTLRMCTECSHALFSHRDFKRSLETRPLSEKLYGTLHTYHKALAGTLRPRLNTALERKDWAEAERAARRMVDTIAGAEGTLKRLKTAGENERLVKAVIAGSESWLREMLMQVRVGQKTVEEARREEARRAKAQHAAATGKKLDDAERKRTLEVLEEQRGLLRAMANEAERERRLDEVQAVMTSLAEIEDEIARLRA